jgi:serine/threonine protein kinase
VATYQLGRRLVAASGVVEAHLGAVDGEWVVVSRLSAPWSQDATFLERFGAHSRASVLTHRVLAPLIEFGSGGDGLWFVERTGDVEPLRALMASKVGSLSVDACVAIIAQAVEGLSALHTKNGVHGDVSASSVFITRAGGVLLLHTGLALVAGSHNGRGPARSEPHAIAPEQLKGASSAATDVFRLGLLFLEMLTGRSLFVASDPRHVLGLAQKFNGVPTSAFQGLPEQLQSLLGWMMQPEPDDRPTVTQLSGVLRLASAALHLATGEVDVARTFQRLMVARLPPLAGRTAELRLQSPKPSSPPPPVAAPRQSPPVGGAVLARIGTRRITHEQLQAVRLEDEKPSRSPSSSPGSSPMRDALLGDQLVRTGKLTQAALATCVQRATMMNLTLADTFLVDGVLQEDELVEALAAITRTPCVTSVALSQLSEEKAPLHLLPQADAERLVAVPLSENGTAMVVAVVDPLDTEVLDALKLSTGRTIQAVRAGERALREALVRLYGGVTDEDPEAWLDRGPGVARKSGVTRAEPVEGLTVSESDRSELELEGRPAARARTVTVSGLDEGQTRLIEVLLAGFGEPGREGIALVQLCGDLARRLNASTADIDKARFVTASIVAHNLGRARPIWTSPVMAEFDAHLGLLALPVKALAPALFDGGKTVPEDLVGLAVLCSFVFAQTAGSTCPTPWQPIIATMRARRLPSVALEALSRTLEG